MLGLYFKIFYINMKRRNEPSVIQHVDRRLIRALRIYVIVMLVMLIIIVLEVLQGKFNILLTFVGIMVGFLIGTIVSRVYHLSWDEETNNVIGRIDWIGAIILVLYLIFVFTRTHYLESWVQGTPLLCIILSLTAGTLLGRVMSTRHGIEKILRSLNF